MKTGHPLFEELRAKLADSKFGSSIETLAIVEQALRDYFQEMQEEYARRIPNPDSDSILDDDVYKEFIFQNGVNLGLHMVRKDLLGR